MMHNAFAEMKPSDKVSRTLYQLPLVHFAKPQNCASVKRRSRGGC